MRNRLLFQFLLIYISTVATACAWWLGVGLAYNILDVVRSRDAEFLRAAFLVLALALAAVLILVWLYAGSLASRNQYLYRAFSSFIERRAGRIFLIGILFYNVIYFAYFERMANIYDDELIILAYFGLPLFTLVAAVVLLKAYRWIMEGKK